MTRAMWAGLAMVMVACTSGGPQTVVDGKPNLADRARAHSDLGLGYYEAGRYQFAIEELNEALKSQSDYVPALVGLALVYMDLKEDAKAESYFKKAQRADAANPMTQNNYGQYLCSRGRTEEGTRQLLAAAANPLYQTPDVALKNAGLCARRAGNVRQAEENFREAVMRNPMQAQSLFNLAEIHYQKGDAAQARIFCERAMKSVETPGPEMLWLAARIERRLGDKPAADRLANQLRRKFPDAPETRAMLEGRYE